MKCVRHNLTQGKQTAAMKKKKQKKNIQERRTRRMEKIYIINSA